MRPKVNRKRAPINVSAKITETEIENEKMGEVKPMSFGGKKSIKLANIYPCLSGKEKTPITNTRNEGSSGTDSTNIK